METHKGFRITCDCGKVWEFGDIQFSDLDCGMCGMLNCMCGKILLPSHHWGDRKLKKEEIELEGKDTGWT